MPLIPELIRSLPLAARHAGDGFDLQNQLELTLLPCCVTRSITRLAVLMIGVLML